MAKPATLERKDRDEIADENWTEERKRCADWIESEIIDPDLWPMSFVEIAELSTDQLEDDGWSRQHVSKTVKHFFRDPQTMPGEASTVDTMHGQTLTVEIHVPAHVDRESYLEGWLAGQRESLHRD